MVCVRCLKDKAEMIAQAPDRSGAWEVYYCRNCNYSWRSSEEEEITVVEKRDPDFQLDKVELDSLLCPNVIPILKK